MPKVFLYFPFTNSAQDADVSDAKGSLQYSDPTFAINDLPAAGPTQLAGLGADDLLLSVAHGDITTPDTMYLNTPSGGESMSANGYVSQLIARGLPKKHQSILLLNCWAGGDSQMATGKSPGTDPTMLGKTSTSELVVSKNSYLQCLASVVAKGLGMKGYHSILVGGFPGIMSTYSATLGRSAFRAGAERVLAQLDHIQWYDCRGNNTSSSPPPVGSVMGRPRSNAVSSGSGPRPRRGAMIGTHRN